MSPTSGPFPWRHAPLDDDDENAGAQSASRMFLTEPGWQIGVKIGSQREFCHMRAPGQDFYHRLLDGEVFLQRDDERVCVACATRRGLIAEGPKTLREAILPLPADAETIPLDLGWCDAERF
jgi:hypothetical protein